MLSQGPGDFQQHLPGNFGQPQRPPHHMEPLRSQSHQGPQDREPMFMGGESCTQPWRGLQSSLRIFNPYSSPLALYLEGMLLALCCGSISRTHVKCMCVYIYIRMNLGNRIKHTYLYFFSPSHFKCRINTFMVVCVVYLDPFLCCNCRVITLYTWRGCYWNKLSSNKNTDISVIRSPCVNTERVDSVRFPGQHMFDHQGPGPLLNSGNSLHHQQLPGQGHMGFGPPRPSFNQPGQSPLGLFQREPSRPNLPPHQGHQGMVNFNQQGGPPNQPRSFMGPRQPFGQQGNIFPHPQVQFGMQVRLRVSDFVI